MPPKKDKEEVKEEPKKKAKHPRFMTADERREMFFKAQKEEKPDFHVLRTDDKEELVPYGLITLDNVLALRGIGRRGRVSQIHGDEGAGKSTLTYQIAANYQKFTGEPVGDYDFERTGSVEFQKRIGINVDACHFEQPESVEECIQDTCRKMRDYGIRFFIFDSIPRMKSKVPMDKILKGEAFKQFGGNHARTMGMFYDLLLPWAAEYDANFTMVNQTRDLFADTQEEANALKWPSYVHPDYDLPGGRICRFTPSVMIELRLVKSLKACAGKEGEDAFLMEPQTPETEGKELVNMVRVRSLKNKVTGMGYRQGYIFIRPGQCVDENMAVRYYARQCGLITYVPAGKRWLVGDIEKDTIIANFENKAQAVEHLVASPDQKILDSLKELTAKKIDQSETQRFSTELSPAQKTLVEGIVDIPGIDTEPEVGKSGLFEV